MNMYLCKICGKLIDRPFCGDCGVEYDTADMLERVTHFKCMLCGGAMPLQGEGKKVRCEACRVWYTDPFKLEACKTAQSAELEELERGVENKNGTDMEYSYAHIDAQIGETIRFGNYEQGLGVEPVEWIVLDKQEGKILVISKHSLDSMPYNETLNASDWEKCTLRQWLNGDFYEEAFNYAEQQQMILAYATADENPEYSTDPGKATRDKLFLLSIKEAKKYFKDNDARACLPTKYTVSKGAYVGYNDTCWWWLRSPGEKQDSAAVVQTGGYFDEDGENVDDSTITVRPAMWLRIG